MKKKWCPLMTSRFTPTMMEIVNLKPMYKEKKSKQTTPSGTEEAESLTYVVDAARVHVDGLPLNATLMTIKEIVKLHRDNGRRNGQSREL